MTENHNIDKLIKELQQCQLEKSEEVGFYNYLHKSLSETINYLIANDFSRLISILYRLDVSEKKLALLLKNIKDVTAGEIIAKMIIERQLQKLEVRKSSTATNNFNKEEKW